MQTRYVDKIPCGLNRIVLLNSFCLLGDDLFCYVKSDCLILSQKHIVDLFNVEYYSETGDKDDPHGLLCYIAKVNYSCKMYWRTTFLLLAKA